MPKSKIVLPEPVLYIDDHTASNMGLDPSSIVKPEYHNKYVFLDGKSAVADLNLIKEEFKRTKRGSDKNAIDRPIVMTGADGKTATLMVADTETSPQEVQDVLGETFEKQEKAIRTQKRNTGNATPVVDTEWVRYVNDLPPSELFDGFFKQTLQDRIEKHRQNPISDPARDPWQSVKDAGNYEPLFESAEIPKAEPESTETTNE